MTVNFKTQGIIKIITMALKGFSNMARYRVNTRTSEGFGGGEKNPIHNSSKQWNFQYEQVFPVDLCVSYCSCS